jgi:hypothetical protein
VLQLVGEGLYVKAAWRACCDVSAGDEDVVCDNFWCGDLLLLILSVCEMNLIATNLYFILIE